MADKQARYHLEAESSGEGQCLAVIRLDQNDPTVTLLCTAGRRAPFDSALALNEGLQATVQRSQGL